MDRQDAHNKANNWIDEKSKPYNTSKWHYGKFELHRDIDRLYDEFEKLLEEKDKQIKNLLEHSDFDN